MTGWQAWADDAWAALADVAAPDVQVSGESAAGGLLAGPLPVEDVAIACAATALRSLGALARAAGDAPALGLDRPGVAAAVTSERHVTLDGRPVGGGFAPLSRFWPAADGWVRTHGNYPWHAAALRRALGLADGAPAGDLAAAIADRPARQVEDDVTAAGGVAAAVRSPQEWASSPQGTAAGAEPLVGREDLPGSGRRRPRPVPRGVPPLSGVRVLDLTRVIAGPVATRWLGALGADVLRLDPPHRPDGTQGEPGDTLLGKRSAILDLAEAEGARRLARLLDAADVLVCGYRPGALDRFGLDDATLGERHPGLVVVRLCAWGHRGPWASRRGFDSVVQAASGIAATLAAPDGTPGALPCQLLDHGTGYLAAAAALDGLRRRTADPGSSGTQVYRLSLARTSAWLLAAPHGQPSVVTPAPPLPPGDRGELPVAGALQELHAGARTMVAVRPPGSVAGQRLRWPEPPGGYGTARTGWTSEE